MNDDNSYINPAAAHYQEMQTIFGSSQYPLANVFYSYTDENYIGNVFLFHGLGGSPIEPVIINAAQAALAAGFNIAVIEGYDLSATAKPYKLTNPKMTSLSQHRHAFRSGIRAAKKHFADSGRGHNILLAHSLGCRAVSDVALTDKMTRKSFDEMIFVAPYFMPDKKLAAQKYKFMQKDPTGELWKKIASRPFLSKQVIDGAQYSFSTCAKILDDGNKELPQLNVNELGYEIDEYIRLLFESQSYNILHHLGSRPVSFILGTADEVIDFGSKDAPGINYFCRNLPIQNKKIIPIAGANHRMDNVKDSYMKECLAIFARVANKARILQFT